MFYNCSVLTNVPQLSASKFTGEVSFRCMFEECGQLNALKVEFEDWDEEQHYPTADWMNSVASEGVFTCPVGLPVKVDGSHIPEGWVVTKRFTLPTGTLSGSYVVSNVTGEATLVEPIVSQMGGNVYEIAVGGEGETIEVYVKPGPGCIVQGQNPLRVNLYDGIADFKGSLPKAVLPVAQIVTDNGATTNLYASVQDAFDSEFTADQSVTNTVTLLRDYTETANVNLEGVMCGTGMMVFGDEDLVDLVGDPGYVSTHGRRTARLDLNGYTLTGGCPVGDDMMPVVLIGGGSVLILDDSSEAKTGVLKKPSVSTEISSGFALTSGSVLVNCGELTLNGGVVYGSKCEGEHLSGTIGVLNLGNYIMAGGAIEDCTYSYVAKNFICAGLFNIGTAIIADGKVKDAIINEFETMQGQISISGGLFGTGDVKDNPDWLAEGVTCEANTDPATFAEGYAWKVAMPAQVALEGIFDTANTPTVVELMRNGEDAFVGYKVILGQDYGPLAFSNDFGAVTIDLNGWTIRGADGANGSGTTAGGNGGTAITVAGTCGANLGDTTITVRNGLVPMDREGFDYTTDGVTFLSGHYCVVDLATGAVTEMMDVQDGTIFNTDEYKTTKMAFRYVPAGKFKAKCATESDHRTSLTENDVELSAYWMAIFPITEAQYNLVCNGAVGSGTMRTKVNVSRNSLRGGSWNGASGAPAENSFIDKLNRLVAAQSDAADYPAASGQQPFDLCTSFQLERATRAGTRTDYFFSNDKTASDVDRTDWADMKPYAWYKYSNYSD